MAMLKWLAWAALMVAASADATGKPGVRHRAKSPVPLYSLFSTDDYPLIALRRMEHGTTTARFTITPEGRVANCRVTVSASPSLDAKTCAVLVERARFVPARDARGTAVADRDKVRVRWVIPNDDSDDSGIALEKRSVVNGTTIVRIAVRGDMLVSCSSTFTPPLADPGGAESQIPCAQASAVAAYYGAHHPPGIGANFIVTSRWQTIVGGDLRLPTTGPLEVSYVTRVTINANGQAILCERIAANGILSGAAPSACGVSERTLFTPLPPDAVPTTKRVLTTIQTTSFSTSDGETGAADKP